MCTEVVQDSTENFDCECGTFFKAHVTTVVVDERGDEADVPEGAENCRKKVRSDDYKRADVRAHVGEYFPPWMKSVVARYLAANPINSD